VYDIIVIKHLCKKRKDGNRIYFLHNFVHLKRDLSVEFIACWGERR